MICQQLVCDWLSDPILCEVTRVINDEDFVQMSVQQLHYLLDHEDMRHHRTIIQTLYRRYNNGHVHQSRKNIQQRVYKKRH